MIELSTENQMRNNREIQKARIIKAYASDQVEVLTTETITPEQFEKSYPESDYERYSEAAVNKYADDFSKSEDVGDAEVQGTFNKSIEGLSKVTVAEDGKQAVAYVRKKDVEPEVE